MSEHTTPPIPPFWFAFLLGFLVYFFHYIFLSLTVYFSLIHLSPIPLGYGDLIAFVTLITVPITLGLLIVIQKNISYYYPLSFELRWTSFSQLIYAFFTVILLYFLFQLVTHLLNKPLVHPFVSDILSSNQYPVFLFFALVFFGPLYEEILFRGWLHTLWSNTFLGYSGSIFLTSIIWAIIHTQYGLYEWTLLFIFGVILSLAKIYSRSLLIPYFMHALFNALVFFQGITMKG